MFFPPAGLPGLEHPTVSEQGTPGAELQALHRGAWPRGTHRNPGPPSNCSTPSGNFFCSFSSQRGYLFQNDTEALLRLTAAPHLGVFACLFFTGGYCEREGRKSNYIVKETRFAGYHRNSKETSAVLGWGGGGFGCGFVKCSWHMSLEGV